MISRPSDVVAPKLSTSSPAAGALLIEVGTRLPPHIRIDHGACSSTWASITFPDRRALERELNAVGWNFFFFAGKTTATALGFDREKTHHRAVNRVLERIRLKGFNCAEITAVRNRSFCGVPCVTVSAHARHVQRDVVMQGQRCRTSVSAGARNVDQGRLT